MFWQLLHKSDISVIAFFSGRLADILLETLMACSLYTAAHIFFYSKLFIDKALYILPSLSCLRLLYQWQAGILF